MKITSARVIVACPGRNFVTLKIETDEGVSGIGDATLNGRELAVASYLTDHVIPCLIGMDPQRIEDIWQYFYRGAYWRRGPVTMSAIAAVDTALWDIKGKMAGMPLYQLLGGRSRDRVLVYGHANGRDLEETVDAVGQYIELGYKAIRAQSGIPESTRPTASGAARCTTSRPTRGCRRIPCGTRRNISTSRPSCSRSCARPTASSASCCTTCTTG